MRAPPAGCNFENFDGDRLISAEYGSITLENSKLSSNDMSESMISALSGTGFVWIANTTIASSETVEAPTLLAWKWRVGDDPVFYADKVRAVTRSSLLKKESSTKTAPLSKLPASQRLTAEDPILVSMQKVRTSSRPARGGGVAPMLTCSAYILSECHVVRRGLRVYSVFAPIKCGHNFAHRGSQG